MDGVTVHLVRHASHGVIDRLLVGRSPGVSLSGAGRDEAGALARRLVGTPVAWIETSPRERARETAEILATALARPLRREDALDEVDFGAWTGRSFEDLADDADWRAWNAARAFARAPGGETMGDVLGRLASRLRALRREAPADPVVVVSHAEPIRAVLLAALGLGADAWARLAVDPASLSTIRIDDHGVRVLRVNERPRP